MFSNARNVVFTGNSTFTSNITGRTLVPQEESLGEEIKILAQHVAKGAMYNSGERFDAPTCHPETRIALQDDVFRWIDEPPGGQLVIWLSGPAGAGKSAIAQTISQKLHAKGQLTASFFFSRRESASQGRGDESALIATLAYQLALNVPATKPLIAHAVRENPLIFDLSLDDQIQALIATPLTLAHQHNSGDHRPRVIVIDGLDECRRDNNAHSRVVRALIMGLNSITQRSHKLLITSRPEHNIVTIFKSFKPELVRKMELNNDWKPDEDIRAYLLSEFAEIRSYHPYFETYPADQTWPTDIDIKELVTRSSSQFIYASVVLKYIKSEDYHDPAARLQVVLQLHNNEDQPYTELDALYQYIFSQVRDIERVLIVLSMECVYSQINTLDMPPLGLFLPDLVGARIEEIKFYFRPLVSLLVWEGNMIRYMHASLPDFLVDSSRSKSFCINSLPIASKIVRRTLDLMEDKNTATRYHLLLILLRIPPHYSGKSFPDEKTHILSMISGFSFVENVLHRMGNQTSGDFRVEPLTVLIAIGSYLEWIVTEIQSENPPGSPNVLAGHLFEIQTWLMRNCNLVCESFKRLDDADEIDLWPFLTIPTVYFDSIGIWQRISDLIASTVGICRPTTLPNLLLWNKDVQPSNQTVLLYCLLPHIPSWLASTDLLGDYAITKERYGVAFIHTLRFLLRLPAAVFRQALAGVPRNEDKWSSSMRLARRAFFKFLDSVPQSIDMYFFVLFMHSVVAHPSMLPEEHDYTWIRAYQVIYAAKRYLEMTRKKFLVLKDPTSPEYIQAQADAEAIWAGFERDPHDPVSPILFVLPFDMQ